MRLPNFRRIFKGDFDQEDQSLVDQLSVTINNGLEVVYNALARNISLSDNIACTVRTFTVIVDSAGVPRVSTGFKIDTLGTIKGISVIKAVNTTNSSVYPTSAPFITYTQNDTIISIVQIAGIPTNNNFDLTVIAWA